MTSNATAGFMVLSEGAKRLAMMPGASAVATRRNIAEAVSSAEVCPLGQKIASHSVELRHFNSLIYNGFPKQLSDPTAIIPRSQKQGRGVMKQGHGVMAVTRS
jgi:hypothetical protein